MRESNVTKRRGGGLLKAYRAGQLAAGYPHDGRWKVWVGVANVESHVVHTAGGLVFFKKLYYLQLHHHSGNIYHIHCE